MNTKRLLTIQDISCVGQCSLTVALPIISACGVETAVLPSALLSNHTAFPGFTFKDLSSEIPKIHKEWLDQDIQFDAVYTGYLGSSEHIALVKDIFNKSISPDGIIIVDPAMADSGKLYTGFDEEYVTHMKQLCKEADIILPNITEACLLTDTEYKINLDKEYVESLLYKLANLYNCRIILTGVSFHDNANGVAVYENNTVRYYEHIKVGDGSHGTGDVYASAFTGALLNGMSIFESAKLAADFTVLCIENTVKHPEHWYGVRFEGCIESLINMIKN